MDSKQPKRGETWLDNFTGRHLVVIDDNNKKPLAKYYCECADGFACWRNAKDLLQIKPPL